MQWIFVETPVLCRIALMTPLVQTDFSSLSWCPHDMTLEARFRFSVSLGAQNIECLPPFGDDNPQDTRSALLVTFFVDIKQCRTTKRQSRDRQQETQQMDLRVCIS